MFLVFYFQYFLIATLINLLKAATNESVTNNYIDNADVNNEAKCRVELHDLNTPLMYALISTVAVLSIGFLAISIYVFVYIQKHLLSEMNETIHKAHDVMDAVLVSLIPNHLIEEIGANENKPKKKND